jgi:hypothetical protein
VFTAQEYQLLDAVVQRAMIDAEFRQMLLTSPQGQLQDAGLSVSGLIVTVLEYDEDKLVLVLPPPMAFSSSEEERRFPADSLAAGPRADFYSDQPPASPMRGLATTALTNFADDRVALGVSSPRPAGGGA